MTINLETELVGSSLDPVTRVASYTIERNGKRWTVRVPIDHFEHAAKHLKDVTARKRTKREHLGKLLENAMNGPHDV